MASQWEKQILNKSSTEPKSQRYAGASDRNPGKADMDESIGWGVREDACEKPEDEKPWGALTASNCFLLPG